MKQISILLLLFWLSACNQQTGNTQTLQNRVDSLESELANTYKPGFGEFMSSIQIHHDKLWFAGKNENWELADFEINEIKESLTGIKEYCGDRTETKDIGMINPGIDSVSNAIQQKKSSQFRSSYELLTTTCNSCHQATHHEFNVIKIPDTPPFSNQVFSASNKK